MIVPEYWAEAKIQQKISGRSVTIKRFGWSNESPEDAQEMANQRAQEVMNAKISGKDVRRIDHKVAYNGAEGLPIREEVISRIGEQVITRNSYGALCLNSPDVLFADMDFENFRTSIALKPLSITSLLVAVVLGIISGELVVTFALFIGIFIILYSVKSYLNGVKLKKNGGIEQVLLNHIESFSHKHRTHLMRIYRTPFGMRVLFMNKTFDPQSDEVSRIFSELNADPIYSSMCRRQNCFRARISPKPWRMKMERLKKTGVWPLSEERLNERKKWVDSYEQKAKSFASCKYLKEMGSGSKDKTCEVVRKIHDEYSRAGSVLDLA